MRCDSDEQARHRRDKGRPVGPSRASSTLCTHERTALLTPHDGGNMGRQLCDLGIHFRVFCAGPILSPSAHPLERPSFSGAATLSTQVRFFGPVIARWSSSLRR